MIPILLSCLLALGVAAQQQNPTSTSGNAASPPASVKPKDSVMTIRGICRNEPGQAGNHSDCETSVTREQFEKLLAAVATAGQTVPPSGRQQFAQTYAELLAFAEAARSSGTESSPEFRDLMDLIRIRTLAEIYRRNLEAKVHAPSQTEIDDYYRRSPGDFTNIKLRRILVPRRNPSVQNQEEYETRALQVVTDLRERAAKGEDFDTLQKEAFASLGLASPPPATVLGNRRKSNLLQEERDEILGLNAGGVSRVEKETFSLVIYKVEEKSLLAEEQVKDEISREISRQRFDSALKEVTSGVHSEFNRLYFPAAPPTKSATGSQQPPGNTHP